MFFHPLFICIGLYCIPNHISHGIRRLPHHLRRGVGIGAEGKSRRVVAQGAGQGLYIHAVFQGQRCECMSEVVESDMLRADGLENLLMGMPKGIRVEHSASLGRWEHIRIPWMLFVFRYHQVHCLL